ncbi:type VI secretion system baseplate subunit TssF [Montanilutibacter psychrotolerans]|uniref:Type VI secretion system baseplate subunit TssF n=1 Tax=Montanilutibacter psychrotolerans TaxID=1327343 RepID=A0A3M8ST40_9GAMM|nr:type VI secretion system baseplate subunit TssF [Lysobacter psychrotolerans]RNF82394.1 type VI secretion system baseplate subunit TssF [Lysobacter psychrotolerans]
MEDLLPYYERELAYLRRYGREFAERYPKIAGRLLLSGDGSQDPHVERLIESFALLSARVNKKVEDDYPEFTEALLEVLYPHYLRPFPSCSIARFDMGNGLAKLSAPVTLERDTLLHSRSVRGVSCRFRSCYDVVLAPIRLNAATFKSIAEAPMAVSLPQGVGGQISLSFELLGDHISPAALGLETLRLFTDGEPSFCSALRDTLALGVRAAFVEVTGTHRWHRLDKNPLQQTGFREDESLIDFPERSHPAYRLLTELFAFPEKFGFFDLDLHALRAHAGASFTVHLVLASQPPDSPTTRVLEGLTRDNVLLGCTPVVNLFAQHGEPIRVTHRAATYPVVADARRAFAYEVYSIDSVRRVRQTPQGEQITEFRPFYSLHHGETPDQTGHYWVAHRDEDVARHSPGFETELSFVDLDFNPVLPQTDVASIELTCSNRDLPNMLAYGVQGGDLTLEGGGVARTISLLRKPSKPLRFDRGRGAHWRLISHLSLNHLSLTQSGLPALKEMLRLYDMARSAVTSRQIDGIVGLEHVPTTAWLPGKHFASVVRGVEIRLTIEENSFVGAGIAAFTRVLDHFFGLYVHANSFTQLVLLSSDSGEEIVRCAPRSGESILV